MVGICRREMGTLWFNIRRWKGLFLVSCKELIFIVYNLNCYLDKNVIEPFDYSDTWLVYLFSQ